MKHNATPAPKRQRDPQYWVQVRARWSALRREEERQKRRDRDARRVQRAINQAVQASAAAAGQLSPQALGVTTEQRMPLIPPAATTPTAASESESEVTDDGEDPATAAAAVGARPHAGHLLVSGHCGQAAVNTATAVAPEPAPRAAAAAAAAAGGGGAAAAPAAAAGLEQQQAATMSHGPKVLHGRDLNTHHFGAKQQLLPQKRRNPFSSSQATGTAAAAAAAAAVPSADVLPDYRPHKYHQLVTLQQQQQQQQQQCSPHAGKQAAPTDAQLQDEPGARTATNQQQQQQSDCLALRWRVMSLRSTPLYDQLKQLTADPLHWPVLQKALDFWTGAQGNTAAAAAAAAAARAVNGSSAGASDASLTAHSSQADSSAAGSSTEAASLLPQTTKIFSRWEWQGLIDHGIPDLVLQLYGDLDLARSAGICNPVITVDQAEQLLLLPGMAAVKAVFAAGPSSSNRRRIKGGVSMLGGTAEAADLVTAVAAEQQQQQRQRSNEDDSIQMKKSLVREMLLLCKLVMAALTTGRASADQFNLTAAMLAAAAAAVTGAGSGSTVQELDDLAALCWQLRTDSCRLDMLWQQYKQQQQQQHGKERSADVTMSDTTNTADASQTWSILWQLVSKQTCSNQQQQQEQGIREVIAAAAAAMRGISLHALQQLLALLAKAAAAGGCAVANVLNALNSKQCISSIESLLTAMFEVFAAAIRLQVRIVPAPGDGDLEKPMQQRQLQQGDDPDIALSTVSQQQQQQVVDELLPTYTAVLIKALALAAKLPTLSQQQQQQPVGMSAITGLISEVTTLSREVLSILLFPREKLATVLSFVLNVCDVIETTQEVLDDVLALVTGALSALSEVDHSPHLAGAPQPSSKNLGVQVPGLQVPQGVTAEGWDRMFESAGAGCREVSKLLADTLATLCQ